MAENIIIRKAEKADMPEVLNLIRELAIYEKAPDAVTVTVENLVKDGFGEHPLFHVILAILENKAVGMAFYYYSYSTWEGKCIFLEDIIVKQDNRRMGIGGELFREIIRISREEKVARLMWQVLDWNEPAISFYRKYNAIFDPTWINVRLKKDQFGNH